MVLNWKFANCITEVNFMQGLRQKILAATSVEALEQLLITGKTYEFASKSTRNSWKNAGRRKSAYLKGEKPPVIVAPVEEYDEVKKVKKYRGNKKKLNPVVA